MNKKGAELAIGTIVVIILALVVLVVIIYGLIVGWGNLFQNILGFGGGQVNVQTVVQSCQVACLTQSSYDYCKKQRNVVFEEGEKGIPLACEDLEVRNVGLDDCSSVDCGERSVCVGDIDSKVCDDVKTSYLCGINPACKWRTETPGAAEQSAKCFLKEGVDCSIFNNNKQSCDSTTGCTWQ